MPASDMWCPLVSLRPGTTKYTLWPGRGDPSGGAGAPAQVGLMTEDGTQVGVVRVRAAGQALLGVRHRVMVELAFGREEHVLPQLEAEPAIMQVEIKQHKEILLSALGEIRALSPGRAAEDREGRFDG